MIVTGCVLVDLHQHSGASRSVASRHHYCGFQTAMRSSTCPPANTKTQHNVSQQRLFVTSSLRMTRADRRRRTADVAQVWWFFLTASYRTCEYSSRRVLIVKRDLFDSCCGKCTLRTGQARVRLQLRLRVGAE